MKSTYTIPNGLNFSAANEQTISHNLMKVFDVFKAYFFHFIFVLIFGIYGLIVEKDINTVLFISCLAFVISIGIFIFNFGITASILIFIENDKNRILAFLIPSLFMILFFKPINIFLKHFDFGPDGFYWLIFFVSTIINVLSYFLIERSKTIIKEIKK